MQGLRIENVGVTYAGDNGQDVVALQKVDLSFARGEFVVAVGPSTCRPLTKM